MGWKTQFLLTFSLRRVRIPQAFFPPITPYRSFLDNKKLCEGCSVAMSKSQSFSKWLIEEELLPSDLFFLCVWWIPQPCSVHFTKEALTSHRVCIQDSLSLGKCQALSSKRTSSEVKLAGSGGGGGWGSAQNLRLRTHVGEYSEMGLD